MDPVAQVRSFNRVVTARIGALQDGYLDRGRPLGASRVLWELDPAGTDLRELRERLGLDSGYLSRLLRMLQSEGLVTVAADGRDARARVATPTAAGLRERDELDRRSDALAERLLAPLGPHRQGQLIAAMATVERLLTAGLVELSPEPPTTAAAREAIGAYFAELDTRFETGFDPARSLPGDDDHFVPPRGVLVLARLGGRVVGCGAVRVEDGVADIKRMWVHPDARGLGLGSRILRALEEHAAQAGASIAHLETNRSLVEAIAMYRGHGYREVPAFNDEPYAQHWFEKHLAPSTPLPGR